MKERGINKNMNKISRIKELIGELYQYGVEYYKLDNPSISDKAYDKKYNELVQLEKETGYIVSNSPTQKVQGEVLPFLTKVKHSETMLSADKSKDINDIIKFMGNKECLISWKLDGLTIVLKYNEGKFIQAVTRGGGVEGEDVTHTVRTFSNIPLTIDYKGYLELRGEGLVPLKEFDRINEELLVKGEETYASARNLSAGSVRQLDANITKSRNLIFLAFGIVKCDDPIMFKNLQFDFLTRLGFEVVYHVAVDKTTIVKWVDIFKGNIANLSYLIDGVIIEFNDIIYGVNQGVTGHHSKNMIALKFSDDSYETIFRGVELNATRTGMVSVTALFDTVNIDGCDVSRATLHNYDVFESYELGIGDTIITYRANSVVPAIDDNLTRSNTYKIDMICPSCGEKIVIKKPKKARFLFCENKECSAKPLQKFIHYASKSGMNIMGLGEAIIEEFVNKGFIKTIPDIYELEKYKNEIVKMDGYGLPSYNKIIKGINNSKKTNLQRLLTALGVPTIGTGTAKDISKHFKGSVEDFMDGIGSWFDFSTIEGIGSVTQTAIYNWFKSDENIDTITDLIEILEFEKEEIKVNNSNVDLTGKIFVITGGVRIYKNRDEIKAKIELLGGKASGSVSKKTSYLICNEPSNTGKYKDASDLEIPILTEEAFQELIKEI